MTVDRRKERLRSGAGDFVRFGLVGISNSLVDFGVTNLLVLTFQARSSLSLMAISIVACALATLNSYLLNRKWTFRRSGPARRAGEVSQFFAVALMAMLVNTSIFLFVTKYSPDRLAIGHLAAVNLGKLAGIVTAFAFSFLGYRFGVFQTERLRAFRRSFRFPMQESSSFAAQAAILILAAALVRAGYLLLTTAVFGDAVNYAWVADSLSKAEFSKVDASWCNLFCYWEALFHLSGLDLSRSAIAASFVPGILLVLPVVWIARALFGSSVAWLAGLLTVAHPRLVEYSCNGYAETFYLCAFALGSAFLLRVFQTYGLPPAFAWGLCFGLYSCVRSEGLLAFALSGVVCALVLNVRRRVSEADSGAAVSLGIRRIALVLAVAVVGFVASASAYAVLSVATVGKPGVLPRTMNLVMEFSEQSGTRAVARETNAGRGASGGVNPQQSSLGDTLAGALSRVSRNVLYSLERIPGVLLSPILLFALILPFFAGSWGRGSLDELPPLLMAGFPLLFYPLVQVEPRVFLPVVLPVHIFGAAGLAAFSQYVGIRLGNPAEDGTPSRGAERAEAAGSRFYGVVAASILVVYFGLTAWRGVDVERGYAFHRELGAWIGSHVNPDDVITGCGYGYVSTTGFVVSRRMVPRIWAGQPSELAEFARQHSAGWIIVYEPFLRAANPELLSVLDSGIPGFEKVYEIRDYRGWRSQIYRRNVGKDKNSP